MNCMIAKHALGSDYKVDAVCSGKDALVYLETEKPDLILFDGYTNDAYERFMGMVGEIGAEEPDDTTFCGGFEKIVQTMQQKWSGVPIVFVTIHKSAGRDWEIQCKLRALSMEICEKYGIEVIDMFTESPFDTRDPKQMENTSSAVQVPIPTRRPAWNFMFQL